MEWEFHLNWSHDTWTIEGRTGCPGVEYCSACARLVDRPAWNQSDSDCDGLWLRTVTGVGTVTGCYLLGLLLCGTCHMASSFIPLPRTATATLCSAEFLLAVLFHATSCAATTLWSSSRISVPLSSPFAAVLIEDYSLSPTWQATWKLWHRLLWQKSTSN